MKSVCICSSFKFYEKVLDLEKRLKDEGIKCLIPVPSKKYRKHDKPSEFIDNFDQIPEEDKLEEAKRMALKHFERIDNADIVYIITQNGYVGKSVSMEVGYAHAKGKPIYSSGKLEDYAVMSLVDKILSEDELIKVLR